MANRPAWLDLLNDDAVMTASVLRDRITGPSRIAKVVETVGILYVSMERTFYEAIKSKEFIEYDAVLTSGHKLHGLIALTKTADGRISQISITQSPIEAVVWLSRELGKRLTDELGPNTFL